MYMAIVKSDFPILEYDDAEQAVLQPDHEKLGVQLPKKAVFAFLGDTIEKYAAAVGAQKVTEFVSSTKLFPVYVCRYGCEDICLCQAPVGAAAAVQLLDWLIAYGVRTVVSAGACGVLSDIAENSFLVPVRALRDEGASYHYLPPSRFVELNRAVVASIEGTLKRLSVPFCECATWSTDGFFRETSALVQYRRQEGCAAVEMECAALASCAQFRGIRFGMLLYTADSLAALDAYDERGWGFASQDAALHLCLEAVAALPVD